MKPRQVRRNEDPSCITFIIGNLLVKGGRDRGWYFWFFWFFFLFAVGDVFFNLYVPRLVTFVAIRACRIALIPVSSGLNERRRGPKGYRMKSLVISLSLLAPPLVRNITRVYFQSESAGSTEVLHIIIRVTMNYSQVQRYLPA